MPKFNPEQSAGTHTEEILDVITAPPSWILKFGITTFFAVLLTIIALSAIIKFPDIIKTTLKISSVNAPKPVVAKISGKLSTLLVKEQELVEINQPLAYVESTANHSDILQLLQVLEQIQKQFNDEEPIQLTTQGYKVYNLGELQSSFRLFDESLRRYKETINSGFLIKKRSQLNQGKTILLQQQDYLIRQKAIHQQDLELAENEYAMHKKLESQKVETSAELREQQSKLLSKKTPLIQNESAIIANRGNLLLKRTEIIDLENQIIQERASFSNAVNNLISQIKEWKVKYILSASTRGRIAFAGLIQENQFLQTGQEVIYINPENDNYFGLMEIPQKNMGKINLNQRVLVKMKSYPSEEFGIVEGSIISIDQVPYKDSIFFSKVSLRLPNNSQLKKSITLKQGMRADAEIITEDASLLYRVTRNVFKVIENN